MAYDHSNCAAARLPQTGDEWRTDCYQLGKRVTSATCADGCATAASGANRKTRSQGRRIPLPCNPNFPIPRRLKSTADRQPDSKRSPTRRSCRTSNEPQPTARPAEAKSLRSSCGAIATAVADDVAAVAAHQQPAQAPALPGPGGPTGEAARGREPSRDRPNPSVLQPASASASRDQEVEGRGGALHWIAGLGQEHLVQAPQHSAAVQRHGAHSAVRRCHRAALSGPGVFHACAPCCARGCWRGVPGTIVDATNLSPHERRSWIKLAHDFGYEAHAVFFDVPPEVCIERNRRRERNVPEDVMQRMAAKLRPPKFEEGFAKITVVRLKKKDEGSGTPRRAPAGVADRARRRRAARPGRCRILKFSKSQYGKSGLRAAFFLPGNKSHVVAAPNFLGLLSLTRNNSLCYHPASSRHRCGLQSINVVSREESSYANEDGCIDDRRVGTG